MSNIRYDAVPEEIFVYDESKEKKLALAQDEHSDVLENTHLLYVTYSKFETDWHSTLHTHHFSELFYIMSGAGQFQVRDQKFDIHADDLIIINPDVPHTEISCPDSPLEYIVFGMQGLRFSLPDGQSADYDMANYSADRGRLRLYLTSLFQEYQRDLPLKRNMASHLLRVILIHILRHKNLNVAIAQKQKTTKECAIVKSYIDTHYRESICLDDLADIAHLNKYYLVHNFSDTYGLSPINYLLHRRIEESKRLLGDTDYSISQIVQIVGFSSSSYFSQRFRNSVGISPNTYRKQYQNGSPRNP